MKKDTKNTEDILREKSLNRHDGELLLKMEWYSFVPSQKVMVWDHPTDSVSNYHTHDFYEVNYVAKGECIDLVDDQLIHMKQGDFLMMHPGTYHTLYAAGKCDVRNFLLRNTWVEDASKRLLPTDTALFSFLESSSTERYHRFVMCPSNEASRKTLEPLASELAAICRDRSGQWALLAESAALRFLCAAAHECVDSYVSEDEGREHKVITDMLVHMSRHPNEVTLDGLARTFGYSRSHICRMLKNNTGKSFLEKLNEIKIRNACVLLSETDRSIISVSDEAGFDSVEYFYRVFKKCTGMTPGEYRKMNKKG